MFFILDGGYDKAKRARLHCERTGMPLPDYAKRAAPKRTGCIDFYYTAFQSLTTCRQFSEAGIGRIPWNVIMEYADRCGMVEYEADFFAEVIERTDSEYVNRANRKQDG